LNLALSLGVLWVFDVANHFLGLVEGKMSGEREADREREREREVLSVREKQTVRERESIGRLTVRERERERERERGVIKKIILKKL
jgi:hypothetical protein